MKVSKEIGLFFPQFLFFNFMAGTIAFCFLIFGGLKNAFANPVRWFGFGGDSSSLGGMQVIFPSTGALISNPALLPVMESGIWGGILFVQTNLKINLEPRSPENDIQPSIYQSSVAASSTDEPLSRPLATNDLINKRSDTINDEKNYLFHLSGITSLGMKDFRVAFGIVTPVLPLQSFETWYSDEREQFFSNRLHFARFAQMPGLQLMVLSLAQKVSIISFGLTLTVDLTSLSKSMLYIPEGSVQTYSHVNAKVESSSRIRFITGAVIEPVKGLIFSVVLREKSYLEVKGEGRLQLWNFDNYPEGEREIIQPYRFVIGYMPLEVAGGVSYSRKRWGLGVTAIWQKWSDYLDCHAEKPQPPFEDVFSFIISGKFKYIKENTLMAGFGFYPSPVPAQTGISNYVDSHLLFLSIGNKSIFNFWGRKIEVAFSFMAWNSLTREVTKDPMKVRDEFPDGSTDLRTGAVLTESFGLQTNNPGFPGFSSGGWAFSENLTVGFLL